MLEFKGSAALTMSQRQRLLAALTIDWPSISAIEAHFCYFVNVSESLSVTQADRLATLLAASAHTTVESSGNSASRDGHGIEFWVVPRLGTISSWCSKAVDIAHNCGLHEVLAIERGIAFQCTGLTAMPENFLTVLRDTVYDPMTQSVLTDAKALPQLFERQEPKRMKHLDIMEGGIEVLEHANEAMGLALSQQEMEYLVGTYEDLGRNPTDAELMMFAQANSEHCRHKIFNARFIIDGKKQPLSLFNMVKQTHQFTQGAGVLSAYKDNAAVLTGAIGERFFPDPNTRCYRRYSEAIHSVIKVETHNHPTAIAPYPGAATGAGGEIRDEGATGIGAKPKAGLTGFCVSDLLLPDFIRPWEHDYGKPSHFASALKIMIEAPLGSAHFNNEFGRPNLCGFFRSFQFNLEQQRHSQVFGYHKPIMIAGGLGTIRQEHIKGKALQEGHKLVVLGGPAMLIGLGGGAASSVDAGLSGEALDFASVQRENPEMQRRCQEVIDQCAQQGEFNPISFIHDVGAGGLSNALPELIKDGGVGGVFQLRQINNADSGMSPLEIWCNEAQERYVLAVKPSDFVVFEAICQRERCPYAVVGEATSDAHLVVEDQHFHNRVVDLPLATLFANVPQSIRNVDSAAIKPQAFDYTNIDIAEALERVLSAPTVASKAFLVTIGDRSVTGLVAQEQMVGPYQVAVSDVAVTASSYTGCAGEAFAMGERAPLALLNAPASGRMALAEAITNIASARISQLSDIKCSANWMAACGFPGEDAKLYETVKALTLSLCQELGICIPVGKDSLSMQSRWQDPDSGAEKSVISPLSLIISAFAPVVDIHKTVTPLLKPIDSVLLLIDLGAGQCRLGGSTFLHTYKALGVEVPDVDDAQRLSGFFAAIQSLNAAGLLLAYHDRSDGGLWACVLEMAFTCRQGLTLNLDSLLAGRTEADIVPVLLNEELGAVIQVASTQLEAVQAILSEHGLAAWTHKVAHIKAHTQMQTDKQIQIQYHTNTVYQKPLAQLAQIWEACSYRIRRLRDNPTLADEEYRGLLDESNQGLTMRIGFDVHEDISAPYLNLKARPKVMILREQGVNGHGEMAHAFDRVGFESVDVHMSELLTGAQHLKPFKGLVACGGFSYGDVLGAGQGWARTILYNPRAKDSFSQFFDRADTFSLGVCNGCQMLAALKSLIPGAGHWGQFKPNLSEQFEARTVLVKICSSASLFFSQMSDSYLPIAVAHGEGRVEFADESEWQQLENHQGVAMRYVDSSGTPTQRYPQNPNGSQGGITALTSEDGRATIMMPHPERVIRSVSLAYGDASWGQDSPWLRVFANARAWVN